MGNNSKRKAKVSGPLKRAQKTANSSCSASPTVTEVDTLEQSSATPQNLPVPSISRKQLILRLTDEVCRLRAEKRDWDVERAGLENHLKEERNAREQADAQASRLLGELSKSQDARQRAEHAFQRCLKELASARRAYKYSDAMSQQLMQQMSVLQGRISLNPQQVQRDNQLEMEMDDILKEVEKLREAAQQAEHTQDRLAEEVDRLREENERRKNESERHRESSDLVSRQTEALLREKGELILQIRKKDELVRSMEGELQLVHHELDLALADRQLLIDGLLQVPTFDGVYKAEMIPSEGAACVADTLSSLGALGGVSASRETELLLQLCQYDKASFVNSLGSSGEFDVEEEEGVLLRITE